MSRLVVCVLLISRVALAQPVSELPVASSDDPVLYSCKNRTGMVEVTFKPETELKDLVTWVMGFTCKNFMMDPRIVSTARKVTVIAPNKMTAAEAYNVFLGALSTIGLTVVPKGNMLRIVESATVRKEALPLFKKGLPDDTDQFVRYVLRPAYAQPETLLAGLQSLKSDAGDVQQVGSILLITDYASHVRDMLSLVALIDVPTGSDGVYTIPIQHADATKLAEKIGGILGLTPSAGAPKPPVTPATQAAPTPSKIMVDERTNTLIVAASETGYQRVKALVDRLDISLDIDGGATIHVYRLGSAIAEELAPTLTNAIQQQQMKAPGTPTTPGATPTQPTQTTDAGPISGLGSSVSGPVKIIGDKPTNSLIVMSSGRDFLAIKDIIQQLDQPRRQVYIEGMILEVAITKDVEAGISSHGAIPTPDGNSLLLGGVQMPNVSSLNVASLANATGLIGGIVGGPLASATSVLGLGTSIPSYAVLFQALADSSNTNILSAPSFIAVDNEEAKYSVGTNIPYQKGVLPTTAGSTSLTTSLTTNIERQPLVLELDIKPHISTDDTVLLEIKHNSQDLGTTDAVLGPTWTTRTLETRVVVRDQQTVVIGGLMQERESVTSSKVPVLGDIPLLGYLFKYTSKTKKKTNLLILLTPYIVKDQSDLQAIRERKLREHDEFVRSFRDLEGVKLDPNVDYRRKRGMLEEINRALQDVELDAAAREGITRPRLVEPGAIEYGARKSL